MKQSAILKQALESDIDFITEGCAMSSDTVFAKAEGIVLPSAVHVQLVKSTSQ